MPDITALQSLFIKSHKLRTFVKLMSRIYSNHNLKEYVEHGYSTMANYPFLSTPYHPKEEFCEVNMIQTIVK